MRMTEKRFINDIDDGQLIDTKGELSTIDYSDKVDFYELWEFLNKLNGEKEQLKQFKQKVFNLINKKIDECKENYNRAVKAGMPSNSIYEEIELLAWLKKELE